MGEIQQSTSSNSAVRSHADLARLQPGLSVVKLGSSVVTTDVGHLDRDVLRDVAAFASRRLEKGGQTIIISSGAVAAGIGQLGLGRRPNTLPELQALAAVGQGRLMAQWGEAFAEHKREVAQVLVSAEDFRDRRRYLNMRYTFEKLFEHGVVPIVNENDTITIEELRFGDNDGLAQLVAIKMMADLLVFMTTAEGLYGRDGKEVVRVVEQIGEDVLSLALDTRSSRGSGGMRSKLEAARTAAHAGIPVVIAPGKGRGTLNKLLQGEQVGTLILAEGPARYNRRQRFIAFSRLEPRGRLMVDAGAQKALVTGKKSLLPAGITACEGEIEPGYVVDVVGPSGQVIARGITNYSGGDIDRIKGRQSSEIADVLGHCDYTEVIHRDNLVVMEHETPQ